MIKTRAPRRPRDARQTLRPQFQIDIILFLLTFHWPTQVIWPSSKSIKRRENLFHLFIKEIVSRINKELINTKRTNNAINKWANKLDSSQKKYK
jgi:hypothetical protein